MSTATTTLRRRITPQALPKEPALNIGDSSRTASAQTTSSCSTQIWDLLSHEFAFCFQFLGLVLAIAEVLHDIVVVGSTTRSLTAWIRLWFIIGVTIRASRLVLPFVDLFWRAPFFRQRQSTLQTSLEGPDVPLVDILITTCNEDLDIILDTVVAACMIDYPPDKRRITIADDGNDAKLRLTIQALNQKHGHLYYHTRQKSGQDKNPKAVNINSTLAWLDDTFPERAEWVALLDCDMIPERRWLRVLLSHGLKRDRIAMVTPPQCWYNIPINDLLLQSTEDQIALSDPIRSFFGGTPCNGSGFLARRAAIASIGGFAETTLCEDITSTLLLNGQGWDTIYVSDRLQCGLMPDSIDGHISQRKRWAIGNMQTAIQLRMCLDRQRLPLMRLSQRIHGFAWCMSATVDIVMRALELMILPWCMVFVIPQIMTPTVSALRIRAALHLGCKLSKLCAEIASSSDLNFIHHRQVSYGSDAMTPINAVSAILSTAFNQKSFFISSGSIPPTLHERCPEKRACIRTRLSTMLFDPRYRLASVMAFNVGLCYAICIWLDVENKMLFDLKLVFMSRALCPFVRWDEYVTLLVPFVYAAFPPSMPARRELMTFDSSTGGWRALMHYRMVRHDVIGVLLQGPTMLAMLWTMVAVRVAGTG